MIQFIQPLWLFAIAAVAIPVIIHLWNIKEGKTLKIGSIRLLSQSSIQNARSLRWLDLLLLILRCLLIALLAVILSKPLWPQNIHQQKHTGWIVIEQQHLGESYSRFRPLIDSLLKAGFEFHYLAPGYKKAAFKNALKQAQRPFDKKQISYWYLLAGLEHEVPPGMQVHLFTTNQVERFTGNRRRVSLNVKWHTYSPVNSSYSMPVDAYISASDSIRVITAESRPSGTYYTARNLAADKQDTVYRITVRDGKMFLSLNDTGNSIHTRSPSIEVDTATLRITIFTKTFTNDAGYLEAAIQAIQQFTTRKIILSVVSEQQAIAPGQDWVFWLSDQPVTISENIPHLFLYEIGKPQNIQSRLSTEDAAPAIYKIISANDSLYQKISLWEDGFGHPVLNMEKKENQEIYHFFSRFDPAWNDLPWSDVFPAMILRLIYPGGPNNDTGHLRDMRMIDSKQVIPQQILSNSFVKNKTLEYMDLSDILWLAAFFIFAIERIVSLSFIRNESYA